MAAAVAVVLLAGCSGSGSGASGNVFKLKVGDCVVPPTEIKAEITSVTVVPCSKPHSQEVFAAVNYAPPRSAATTTTGNVFPGEPALRTFADGACLQQYAAYVGLDYRDSSLFYTYLLPSARSWNSSSHDRKVVCLVTTTGQQLTASVKGSRQ